MKYIISPEITMVYNNDEKKINVLTPAQINEYQDKGFRYKEHIYKLTIENHDYELVCAEIWKKGDTEHSVIIPPVKVPHRPYALEVYLYAVNLYSENPKMSQRAAADATKKEFKLESFSHTTIGRAVKALSLMLTQHSAILNEPATSLASFDVDAKIEMETDTKEATTEAEKGHKQMADENECKKNIPAAKDTKKKREIISAFFNGRLNVQIQQDFIEACKRIAEWWYARFNKILI